MNQLRGLTADGTTQVRAMKGGQITFSLSHRLNFGFFLIFINLI